MEWILTFLGCLLLNLSLMALVAWWMDEGRDYPIVFWSKDSNGFWSGKEGHGELNIVFGGIVWTWKMRLKAVLLAIFYSPKEASYYDVTATKKKEGQC